MSRLREALRGARAAIALLTIVPVGHAPADPRAAAGWFPLVGGAVGALAGGAWVLIEPLLGGAYASALALTLAAVVAGALHHDGLADMADGLGARGDRDRRLAAMRDSGIGAYGALALIAYALLSLTALSRLAGAEAAAALVCAGALGRWSTLPQLARLAPARRDGLGAAYEAGPGAVVAGSGCAGAITLACCGIGAGAAALGGALLAAVAVAGAAQRCAGGRTGDTLGASVLVTEVVVYSVLAAWWGGLTALRRS